VALCIMISRFADSYGETQSSRVSTVDFYSLLRNQLPFLHKVTFMEWRLETIPTVHLLCIDVNSLYSFDVSKAIPFLIVSVGLCYYCSTGITVFILLPTLCQSRRPVRIRNLCCDLSRAVNCAITFMNVSSCVRDLQTH
jgi:hypothetical protein